MATISEFKAALSGGGARANQYRVELVFPGFVAAGAMAGAKAQFLCSAASMPESTIDEVPVAYRGRQIKLAGDRQFGPWNITVYNDTDFIIRNAFEQWMDGINNHTAVGGLTTPQQYYADLGVHQLDKNSAVLKSYKMIDAWPVSVDAIQLSYEGGSQVETFNVNFALNYWTSDTTS